MSRRRNQAQNCPAAVNGRSRVSNEQKKFSQCTCKRLVQDVQRAKLNVGVGDVNWLSDSTEHHPSLAPAPVSVQLRASVEEMSEKENETAYGDERKRSLKRGSLG